MTVSLFQKSYLSLIGFNDFCNCSIDLLTNWPCLGTNYLCIRRKHLVKLF